MLKFSLSFWLLKRMKLFFGTHFGKIFLSAGKILCLIPFSGSQQAMKHRTGSHRILRSCEFKICRYFSGLQQTCSFLDYAQKGTNWKQFLYNLPPAMKWPMVLSLAICHFQFTSVLFIMKFYIVIVVELITLSVEVRELQLTMDCLKHWSNEWILPKHVT